jgi:hypothetical protein
MTRLRARIEDYQERNFPQSPSALGQQLRRLAPDLAKQGIEVDFGRHGKGGDRKMTIRRV